MNRTKNIRRAIALAVGASLLLGVVLFSADADNSIDRALHQRTLLVKRLDHLHRLRQQARIELMRRLDAVHHTLNHLNAEAVGRNQWMQGHRLYRERRDWLRLELQKLRRQMHQRVAALRRRRSDLTEYVKRYGIFRRCPVAGPHVVANNFGVLVRMKDVPVHIHEGNDISASTGTPIVAPFDGMAVASSSELGGTSVKVYGPLGYAYNAHLSGYGRLGQVKAGTVIGYVGSTGDAQGPHDHFEWHPGNGPAVDPYPYLMAVC